MPFIFNVFTNFLNNFCALWVALKRAVYSASISEDTRLSWEEFLLFEVVSELLEEIREEYRSWLEEIRAEYRSWLEEIRAEYRNWLEIWMIYSTISTTVI